MKSLIRLLAVAAVCLLAFAAPASAQYMFLDSNGDGLHTVADRLNTNGVPTTVDLYIVTNQNRTGNVPSVPGLCNTESNPAPDDIVSSTTSGSTTVASAGLFGAAGSTTPVNIGDVVVGTGIPAGAVVTAKASASSITISVAATATGSPTLTFNHQLMTINSYGIAVHASNGTVSYSNFVNNRPEMTTVLEPFGSDATDMTAAQGGGTKNPEGKYKVMTMTVTGASGSPSLSIIPDSPLNSAGSGFTFFGTLCSGQDFDNTYKLIGTINGTGDFADVDGLDAAPGGNLNPAITAPATVSGTENTLVSIVGSANDPDGTTTTLSQTNNAPFLAGPASAGPSANPSITLTGTPSFTQSGSYSVNWSANDGAGGSASATSAITIANGNRPPVITAPATVSGTELSVVSVTASASDPDADNMLLSQTNNAAFLTGPASAGPALNPSVTLTGTPSSTQSGSYSINWTGNDLVGGTSGATTTINIANANGNPIITAPATVNGTESTAVSITGSATDPDAQNVTLSQTNNAAFLAGAASAGPALNPSITLTGTPSVTQSGSYTVNWSANDGAGGTAAATTALTIANLNQNPVITALATVSGTENSPVSVTGSATDADGQLVTLSQTNNAPFLAGPASAGPALSPSITLTGTPSFTQSGSYTINWSATDIAAGSATATTALTIANLNRNPAITAPANVNGATGATISATGSASDPDAQNVTLSQTNNAPFFTASSSSGPSLNPSITLSGTGTTGNFTVNWSATDGIGGTAAATTAVAVAQGNQAPAITAPATVSGTENTAVSITGSATDPDAGQLVTLSQTNNAAFLAGPASAGPVANPSITLTGTPSFTQSGSYTVNWTAVDNNTPTAATATASTALTIANLNRVPVITAPATASGTTGSPVSVTGSASDPDAENVTLSQTNNAPFFTASSSAGPSLNPSITLTGTPAAGGNFTVNWSATDASAGTAAATTDLTIGGGNQAPVITRPATVSGTENSPVTITASATDPEGQDVTLSQTNNAPFLTGPASAGPSATPSITLTGTPDFSQSGSYTINWSATDATTGSATSSTALTIANLNRNPAITAPATVSGTENVAVSVTGSASDPDAENVTLSQTNDAAFLAGSASAGPSLNPSITLAGTPSFNQSGSYTVSWSATDASAGTAAATTAITIANVNRNPAITAPATESAMETTPVSITGSASDPDGDNVTLSQTNNAAFLTGAASDGPSLNPSITLSGTPALGTAGSYTIDWSASDASTGTASATTALTITEKGNQNPVITAPATASGTEGSPVSITGSASDPDGDNVTLSQTNNAPFLTGAASDGPSLNPSITLSGAPGTSDAGSYTINWSAADATTGTAAATTALTIVDQNGTPTLDQPADMTVNEGDTATQQLTGSDPDSDPLTFSKVGTAPLFMSVSAAGLVTLAPGFSDAGAFTGTVRISDGTSSDTKTFSISVSNVNRCPTANAGGPYTGQINVPVTLTGAGSSDADGDPLTYNWDFGDGGTLANGATVSHTYVAAATYTVTLTVDDGTCSDVATSTVTIGSEFPATAFASSNSNVKLFAGKPSYCWQIEPANDSFSVHDVDFASIVMSYNGAQVSADASKTSVDSDKNGNGITEIKACFTKESMQTLFGDLPSGRNTVTVRISGNLTTGGAFSTSVDVIVQSKGGSVASHVSPNPLNPSATLSLATSKPGAVKVQVFDVNGRLLRTIADETNAAAGYHDYTIDGKTSAGNRMASGIYFVKIWTQFDGTETKSITILK